MAIRHNAILLCDYLIPHSDGRFTLGGVFQNIRASRIPALKDPMGVYVQFSGEAGDPYEVVLRHPDGAERVLESGMVQAPDALAEHQQWSTTFAAVVAVVFGAPGAYAIVLRSGGEEIHRHEFGVLAPPEGSSPALAEG